MSTALRRGLAAAALAAAALAATVGPAGAHASFLSSEPADQAQLDTAPDQAAFRFSEPVTPAGDDSVKVVDSTGDRVDTGLVDGAAEEAAVGLPDDLPDGTYVGSYVVISEDDHLVRGAVTFAVGDAAAVDVSALTGGDSGGSAGLDAAALVGRAVLYLAALVAAGGVLFLAVVTRRGTDGTAPLARLVSVAGVVALVATVYGWLVQAAQTSAAGLGALASADDLAAVAEQAFGQSALVRLVGLGLLVLAALRWSAGWAPVVGLVGAGATVVSFALSGHSAATEPRWLAVGGDIVHTAAAAAWFGGLVLLAVAMRARRAADDVEGAGSLVARFSGLATVAVVVVGLAGIALGWAEVRRLDALTSTSYGITLLVKVGLVAAVAVVGAYNNRKLVPALRDRAVGPAWASLRRTVGLEVVGLVVAVGVTAALVNLVPARTAAAEGEGTPAAPVAAGPFQGREETAGGLVVELVVEPAETGTNGMHLYLYDEDGDDLEEAPTAIDLFLTHEGAGVGPIERNVVPVMPNHGTTTVDDLAIAGEWTVEVEVRVDDFTVERATFAVPIS